MPVLYAVHPDKEELSKIRHILNGRDFVLTDFEKGEDVFSSLGKNPPDIILSSLGIQLSEGGDFIEIINKAIPDRPIIILANKNQVTEAAKMVGEKGVFDYFLMHPIVDPIRLHLILDKAITQSSLQLNLEALKLRLTSLPVDLSDIFEKHSSTVQNELARSLEDFKDRMKGPEFENILHLLNESEFDSKFEQFEKKDISEVLDKSKESISEVISQRMTAFTLNIQKQIDTRPDFEAMQDLRRRISGEASESANLKVEWENGVGKIARGISDLNQKTILIMDDEKNPTGGLAEMVEKLGYHVLIAHSTRKLMDLAKSSEIDLLICGYNLGDTNGPEVIARIKEGLDAASLPVILLTVNPTQEVIEQARQSGVNTIVKLPFLPRTLLDKVGQYLQS